MNEKNGDTEGVEAHHQVAQEKTEVRKVEYVQRNVEVTRFSIPFGDVLTLLFQFTVAGIIIAIPLAILIAIIINT